MAEIIKRIEVEVGCINPCDEFEEIEIIDKKNNTLGTRKYYVSSLSPEEIVEDKEQVRWYRFRIYNVCINPLLGTECERFESYVGPKVYVGKPVTIGDAAVLAGVEKIDHSFSYPSGTEMFIANKSIEDSTHPTVRCFCMAGEGEERTLLPVYMSEMTYPEYVAALKEYPEDVARLQEGISRPMSKAKALGESHERHGK